MRFSPFMPLERRERVPERIYIAGCDVGQANDPMSLTVLEATGEVPRRRYDLRFIKQWPRNTRYSEMCRDIVDLFRRPPLGGQTLVLDVTGVGRPVRDLLLDSGLNANLVAVNFTGGKRIVAHPGSLSVPKSDIVDSAAVVLEQRRLRVGDISGREALIDELLAFRVKTDEDGKETEEAESGATDDLVMSLALALWHGERHRATGRTFRVVRTLKRSKALRVILAEDLGLFEDPEQNLVVLHIQNPGEQPPERPRFAKLIGTAVLRFCDTGPEEFGHKWAEPLPPWNLPPEQCALSRDAAKVVWRLLVPRGPGAPSPELLVVHAPDNDRRGLSVAQAVCDVLGLKREEAIYRPADDNWTCKTDDPPANTYVYDTARKARTMVVGSVATSFGRERRALRFPLGGGSVERLWT
jgi:hypothetical protein